MIVNLIITIAVDVLLPFLEHLIYETIVHYLKRGWSYYKKSKQSKLMHREYWRRRVRMHPNQVCRDTLELDRMARLASESNELEKLQHCIEALPQN